MYIYKSLVKQEYMNIFKAKKITRIRNASNGTLWHCNECVSNRIAYLSENFNLNFIGNVSKAPDLSCFQYKNVRIL